MDWANSRSRYGAIAMALHWLLAGAIAFMLGLGLFMTSLDETSPQIDRVDDPRLGDRTVRVACRQSGAGAS